MADGSVVIKIKGDDSDLQQTLKQTERKADSAASEIAQSFRKAGNDLGSTISKQLSEADNAYEKSSDVMVDSIEAVIEKHEELKDSIDDVSGDGFEKLAQSSESASRQTTKNMDDVGKGASKMANGVKSASKVAGAALKGMAVVAAAISAVWTAVGVTSVKYNAEMEQLETSFKVMTGSADKAADVMERLRKLGATTPFATKDLASATQLLMQYGFNADEAIDRMSMLGDIAQGDSDKMMRIAAAYGQMNSAGKVSLEDVKQMIDFCHAA